MRDPIRLGIEGLAADTVGPVGSLAAGVHGAQERS